MLLKSPNHFALLASHECYLPDVYAASAAVTACPCLCPSPSLQQLGATLTYLEPANRVGQFVVDVPIKDVSDYVKVGEEEEYDSYYKDTDSNGYYKAPYKPYKDGYEAPPPKYGYEAPAPKYGYKAPPPKYGYTPPSPKYDYDAPPPKYGYEGPPKYRR